jgi:toxin ParE1/3/4
MTQYRITTAAHRDLQHIWDYMIKQWSLNQAKKYIAGLLTCFDALADGTAADKTVDHLRLGYKKLSYGRHIIFFRTAPDQVIEIIRILHVRMDIQNQLHDS